MKYKGKSDISDNWTMDKCYNCGFEPNGLCQEDIGKDKCGKPAKYHIMYDWYPESCDSQDTLCFDICEECYQKALSGANSYALITPLEIIKGATMIQVTLKRKYLDLATIGTLHVTDVPICSILELPWKDNKVGESCIPEGVYRVELHDSPAHGKCFILVDVKDRTFILFHIGNWVDNTKGCLLPGLESYLLNGTGDDKDIVVSAWVSHSGDAMELLLEKFTEAFELTIVDGK